MPKTKFQEIIFTIMMVFMMVYFMICYNIALNIGGMTNQVFLDAFHELVIMGPVAFILDFLNDERCVLSVSPQWNRYHYVVMFVAPKWQTLVSYKGLKPHDTRFDCLPRLE